jgi:hypothetical protein
MEKMRLSIFGNEPSSYTWLTFPQRFHFRTRRQELNSVEGGMQYPSCSDIRAC